MKPLTTQHESDLSAKRSETVSMPLAMAHPGSSVRVVRINAGKGLCERLAAMGLVPGEEVEVLSDGFRGPMIIAIKGSRVILGRGMAHKVQVT